MDAKQLTAALSVLRSIATGKSAMPVCNAVRLAEDGKRGMAMAATDLDTWADITLADVAWVDGPVLVDAKALANVKAKGSVTFEHGDKRLRVKNGASTREIMCDLDPADYPALSFKPTGQTNGVKYNPVVFAAALQAVLPAMCQDWTSHGLRCVSLEDGRLITTDRHRLHVARLEGVFEHKLKAPLRIEAGLAVALAKALRVYKPSKLWAAFGPTESVFYLAADNVVVRLGARVADGVFLNWTQVMRRESPTRAFADFKALAEAIKAVAGQEHAIKLHLSTDGGLKLTRDDAEGKASADVPGAVVTGKLQVVGINWRYLIDAANACQDEQGVVVLGLDEADSPIMFGSEEGPRWAAVMPMRV